MAALSSLRRDINHVHSVLANPTREAAFALSRCCVAGTAFGSLQKSGRGMFGTIIAAVAAALVVGRRTLNMSLDQAVGRVCCVSLKCRPAARSDP